MRKKREGVRLKHKFFWIFLVAFLLISLLFIFTFGQNLTVTGNAIAKVGAPAGTLMTGATAVQTIALLKAGQELHFEIRSINGLKEATVHSQQDIKNGKIIFQEETAIAFSGVSLTKFSVSSPQAAQLGKTELVIKVKESELSKLGTSRLFLYANGKEVPTTKTKSEGGYSYFQAVMDRFEEGQYVIGKAAPKPEVTEEVASAPAAVEGAAIPAAEEPAGESPELVIEQPAPVKEKRGLWGKISSVLKGLFK